MEYNGGLEKAILRDSEFLIDAFCKSHPLLAQKVVTRSARAVISKTGAEALVSKPLSVRRARAGSLLKTIREINAMKLVHFAKRGKNTLCGFTCKGFLHFD